MWKLHKMYYKLKTYIMTIGTHERNKSEYIAAVYWLIKIDINYNLLQF